MNAPLQGVQPGLTSIHIDGYCHHFYRPTTKGAKVRRRGVMLSRSVAIVLGVAALFAGATSAAVQKTDQQVVEVKVGLSPLVEAAPLFMGLKRGFFAKQNIRLKIVEVPNAAAGAAALSSGQVDFIQSSCLVMVNAVNRGLPFKIVSGLTTIPNTPGKGNIEVLVRRDSPIRNFGDLAGKTVGLISLQGQVNLGLDFAVEKQGGDPESIKHTVLPSDSLGPALNAGRVEAAIMQEPYITLAKQEFQVRSLGNPYPLMGKDLVSGVMASSDSYLSRNSGVARRFLRAIQQAADYSAKNEGAVRRVLLNYTSVPPALTRVIGLPNYSWRLPLASIGVQTKTSIRYGWISYAPSAQKLLWRNALK